MLDIFITFLNKLVYLESYTWLYTGFIGGISLEFVRFFYKRNHPFLTFLTSIIPLLCLLTVPFLYFILPYFGLILPAYHLKLFIFQSIVGGILSFFLFRWYAININNIYLNLFKKGYEGTTDVREIEKHLPNTIEDFDPEKYFIKGKIFLGLNKDEKPVYVAYHEFIQVHADVIGTTRAGKGVIVCVIMYQLITLYRQSVVVIAPKQDKWAQHVLKKAALKAGVPFLYIGLKSHHPPQINLLQGANEEEIEELLTAGFGLVEKGKESDVYRLEDRFMASQVAQLSVALYKPTLGDIYASLLEDYSDLHDRYKFFAGALREIAMLDCVNSDAGIDLKSILKQGGVIYIEGSMSNARVMKAQKMLTFRIMQLARKINHGNTLRMPINLFLDEFKYHISSIALQALGADLGNGLHAILAHQSLDDLRGTSADLDPDMVKGAVFDNTKIKICYRQENPQTAHLYAWKSGTIQVQSELKTYEADIGLTMLEQAEKRTQPVDKHFIDTNMLLNLPARCAALYGLGLTQLIFTSPIKVDRTEITVQSYGESKAYKPIQKLKAKLEKLIDVN